MDATVAQIELAREEFIATHRPKLRIRRIGGVDYSRKDKAPTAKIYVANVGDTDAFLFEIGVDIYVRPPVNAPYRPIITGFTDPLPHGPTRIPPGKQAIIDVSGRLPLTINDIAKIPYGAQDGITLCALGVLNYRDGSKDGAPVERSTGFFRIFRPDKGRFYAAPEDDPEADREYED